MKSVARKGMNEENIAVTGGAIVAIQTIPPATQTTDLTGSLGLPVSHRAIIEWF